MSEVLQLVAQHMHGPRSSHPRDRSGSRSRTVFFAGLCGPVRASTARRLRERQPGMVEKGLACGGQLDA